jgi:L-amino acid N-acyltransferase
MRTRLVEHVDAAAMLAIYNPEVVETTVSFDLVPRSIPEQLDWIDAHRTTHPCIVALNDDDDLGEVNDAGERVVGFASVSTFRERPAYATTVENSVYVLRAARGRGVGDLLMRRLIAVAGESGFHSLVARIVGENRPSIALHERCGFTLVGTEIEVGRKHGRWLDVVEYQLVLPDVGRS